MNSLKRKITIFTRFILFSILALFIFSCNGSDSDHAVQNEKISGSPMIEFKSTSYDFGNLIEGEVVECTFVYKNTGTAALKITNVDADCGCTIPEYSEEEILPGEEGKIKAVFNSAGFKYNVYKTIDVETNVDSEIIELVLTAFIENKITLN